MKIIKANKKFFLVFVIILSITFCTVCYFANYPAAITISAVKSNKKCRGQKLKVFEGSNISSYSCKLFLTNDGVVYNHNEDMSELQRVHCLDGAIKLSRPGSSAYTSALGRKIYALFSNGAIKEYTGERCKDIPESKAFFWKDVAAAYDFLAMLNDDGEVWIKNENTGDFYRLDYPKNICSICSYDDILYFTD